ncbi:PREDICTED: RNA-binding motif protein, X-linked 2-like, partial [Amphimedon queenslandica]|uniref:RNA-binding motif protein, X-linked 2 n=1 Tax=Amphimedon queenslandica TaxID=400682 RepID=A0AAN0IKM5_AMPQE
MKSVRDITLRELELGIEGGASWHQQYATSAYIFIGGLDYDLTEGDVLSVFSQYGEIVNINLVRDKKTGKSKGFCFIGYEDQRSTILAVDNFNGIKVCGRSIRVDHVQNYRRPKDEHGNEIIEK